MITGSTSTLITLLRPMVKFQAIKFFVFYASYKVVMHRRSTASPFQKNNEMDKIRIVKRLFVGCK